MKKALHLALVLAVFATTASAQITKGKTLLGGTLVYNRASIGFMPNNTIPNKQRFVTLSPSIGKVVKENLMVGIEADYSESRQNYQSETTRIDLNNSGYGGGVFVRRYVPLVKNFYFFGQADAKFSKSESSQTSNNQLDTKLESWVVSASLSPGLSYAVTKTFYMEAGFNSLAQLGYSHSKAQFKDPATGVVSTANGDGFVVSTSLGTNSGFAIGFRLLL